MEKGGSPPETLLREVSHFLSHARSAESSTHETRRQDSLYASFPSDGTITLLSDDGGINFATLMPRIVVEVTDQSIAQFGVRDQDRMFPAKGQVGGSLSSSSPDQVVIVPFTKRFVQAEQGFSES